jgi:hypothetical protein
MNTLYTVHQLDRHKSSVARAALVDEIDIWLRTPNSNACACELRCCNERMYLQKWCNWCQIWYSRTRVMWSLWATSKMITLSGFHCTSMNYLARECSKTLKFQFCSILWLIWKKANRRRNLSFKHRILVNLH